MNITPVSTTSIVPGSRIVGKSGKYLTVDRIEDEILHCGDLKILLSAVVRVIAPMVVQKSRGFNIGAKVRYIGSNPNLKTQYAGILEVWSISPLDGYTCLKPNERLTSWIEREDLQLVEVAK